MRSAEGIVFAFTALGETRQPAPLTQRADPVTALGAAVAYEDRGNDDVVGAL